MPDAERFTLPADGALSDDMKAAYARDGFLVIEGFKSPDECDALVDRALEIVDDFDPASAGVFSSVREGEGRDEYFKSSGDKIRCFLEDEAIDSRGELIADKRGAVNKIGHAMHDLDPVFDEFSHGGGLAGIAADIGFSDPLVLQSMFIFKPPEIGGEVMWHQDATYLYTEPESVTGFWFALDEATTENGCLQAIPGGHLGPLRSRFRRLGDDLKIDVLDETPLETMDAAYLPARKGDLVLLHGRLPHASTANRSSLSRHAYTLHVIDGACHYTDDNWLRRAPDLPLRGFL